LLVFMADTMALVKPGSVGSGGGIIDADANSSAVAAAAAPRRLLPPAPAAVLPPRPAPLSSPPPPRVALRARALRRTVRS
jgi:hypothetical protein